MNQAVRVALIAAALTLCTGGLKSTPYNNYVLLADAFNHGHVWINWPGAWIDALAYHGRYYIIEGPFPALLLMPFVAVFGTATSQTLLGVALCALSAGLCWTLLERMGVALASRVWLTIFFFAGTDLWWCASLGYVWFIAHLAAVAATLGVLVELAGKRRAWLIAILAICAAESRFTEILALPIYALILVLQTSFLPGSKHDRPLRARLTGDGLLERARLLTLPFVGLTAVAVVAWICYNEARWGLPFDIGYTQWYRQDVLGTPDGSPFGLRYLPYEWHAFFAAMPEMSSTWPYLASPVGGVSLTITSPALVLTLFARRHWELITAMWLLTGMIALPSFLYYVDGGAQFGMRHALDFEPFMLVLMALALRRVTAWWQAMLCAWSAIVGAWGVWYWQAIVHG